MCTCTLVGGRCKTQVIRKGMAMRATRFAPGDVFCGSAPRSRGFGAADHGRASCGGVCVRSPLFDGAKGKNTNKKRHSAKLGASETPQKPAHAGASKTKPTHHLSDGPMASGAAFFQGAREGLRSKEPESSAALREESEEKTAAQVR